MKDKKCNIKEDEKVVIIKSYFMNVIYFLILVVILYLTFIFILRPLLFKTLNKSKIFK